MSNTSESLRRGRQFLIFAGTSEGRSLAEFLNEQRIPAMVCVATEYGEELMQPMPYIQVHTGRMREEEMEQFIVNLQPLSVIDATHPYADQVTANIRSACEKASIPYRRLLREGADLEKLPGIETFPDVLSAAIWLNEQQGNILLTTGMKELPVFADEIEDHERLYARVLLQEGVFDEMEKYGLKKKQVICMQGPFSKEMNVATLRMTGASYLVTKESGQAGGFDAKLEAARETGTTCVVIRRPVVETGDSSEEIRQLMLEMWENYVRGEEIIKASGEQEDFFAEQDDPDLEEEKRNENAEMEEPDAPKLSGADSLKPYDRVPLFCNLRKDADDETDRLSDSEKVRKRRVSLVGIGPGNADAMTVEAVQACREADCMIGANRMLKTLSRFEKPMEILYQSDDIVNYISEHQEYRRFVIGLSGDVGFYSGAKMILERLNADGQNEEFEVQLICGISTVEYFAAKLQIPWEDIRLVSAHGREQNLIGAVRTNEKVFALASDAKSIRQIAEKLMNYGLGEVKMYVGTDLSYESEWVWFGSVSDFLKFDEIGICSVILINEKAALQTVTFGIPDDEFIRGEVPMTKEEVRTVSLSKLRLKRNSVIYDIGAGTGSVSVECARIADQGKVYAIEWKEEGWNLIAQNRKKFAASNLEIVPGRAPEMLEDLPAPTHAFIGGSGGSLKNILYVLLQKNPKVRIVINCIMLETLNETIHLAKDMDLEIEDISCVTVARARTVRDNHMMIGQNPVYIVVLCGHEDAE